MCNGSYIVQLPRLSAMADFVVGYGLCGCPVMLHTYQYQALGPFYGLAYLLSGGFSGPSGNPYEQAAQNYGSGKGSWWPW
jgi:hypothetical protein